LYPEKLNFRSLFASNTEWRTWNPTSALYGHLILHGVTSYWPT